MGISSQCICLVIRISSWCYIRTTNSTRDNKRYTRQGSLHYNIYHDVFSLKHGIIYNFFSYLKHLLQSLCKSIVSGNLTSSPMVVRGISNTSGFPPFQRLWTYNWILSYLHTPTIHLYLDFKVVTSQVSCSTCSYTAILLVITSTLTHNSEVTSVRVFIQSIVMITQILNHGIQRKQLVYMVNHQKKNFGYQKGQQQK